MRAGQHAVSVASHAIAARARSSVSSSRSCPLVTQGYSAVYLDRLVAKQLADILSFPTGDCIYSCKLLQLS